MTDPVPVADRRSALWSWPFTLLCLSTLLCYAHQYMLLPILPLYVSHIGGSATLAGLVLGAFSVMSFGLRPFVGYASDRWSMYLIFFAGTVVLSVCGPFLAIPALAILFVANTARGLGWAGINTAGSAVLARVVPASRRGEGSGYYSVATTSSTAIAPAAALWLIDHPGGFTATFLIAAAAAVLAAVAAGAMLIPGVVEPVTPGGSPSRLSAAALFDRGVVMAAALSVCAIATSPAAVAFLPLYARQTGIENLGVYFVCSGVASVVAPMVAGRYLHHGSRGVWIALGFVVTGLGLGIMIVGGSLLVITVAGVIYGIGSGLVYPALLALALDRADPARPGKAMATFSMAYQIGNAIGALASGVLIDWSGFGAMFLGTLVAIAVGMLLLVWRWDLVSKSAAPTGAI